MTAGNWAWWAALVAAVVGGGYQLFALTACLRRIFAPAEDGLEGDVGLPGVSILKPVRGADPQFFEAIRSHAELDYPADRFEIIFAAASLEDSAVPHIRRLIALYPHLNIRLLQSSTVLPNGKVGAMLDAYRQSRPDFEIVLINDSDIRVEADYLRKVARPLVTDPGTGLVTCLYRALGNSFAGRFEALGVNTDFAPSTLVAPFVGIDEFALGSTLAVRRADLEKIGGLQVLGDYIADDYQLGHRIHNELGLKCRLADTVVETHLGAATFSDAWLHQVRWARTIRSCRGGGYLGLPVTYAVLWALFAALVCGYPMVGAGILVLRLVMAIVSAFGVLHLRGGALPLLLWTPFRDLWAVAIWVKGLTGRSVQWRDFSMVLSPDGKILHRAPDLNDHRHRGN
jgi:ceramide glucosyltransferase